MKKFYIVDDDTEILTSLAIWFGKKGFLVEGFSTPELLQAALENNTADLILIDVNLKNRDGREICRDLKSRSIIKCPVILYSGNPMLLKDYQTYLADAVIEKPFSLKGITHLIQSHMELQ